MQPAPAQVQLAVPSHCTVHAPLQVTVHVLVPVQLAIDLSPSASVHFEPPPHSAVLFAPVACVHDDSPSHVELQPLPQLPVQLVIAAQCDEQSVPQVTLHVFMCWQSNVTPLGTPLALAPPSPTRPPSPKVSPVPPPSVQVPPAAQVQVVSVQLHWPLHCPWSALCVVQPAIAIERQKSSVRMSGDTTGRGAGYMGQSLRAFTMNSTRRFRDQHASLCAVQTGCVSP